MLGFQMVPVPPIHEVINLLTDSSCEYRDWSKHQEMHQLSFDQLMWVIDVAKLKTCYRMVSSSRTKATSARTINRINPDLDRI